MVWSVKDGIRMKLARVSRTALKQGVPRCQVGGAGFRNTSRSLVYECYQQFSGRYDCLRLASLMKYDTLVGQKTLAVSGRGQKLGMTKRGHRGWRPVCSSFDERGKTGKRHKFDSPRRMVHEVNDKNHTAYTVRLSTGSRRGSALSDPTSALLLCLLGIDGTAYLHRIPVLTDPRQVYEDLQAICDGGGFGPPPGSNCDVALASAEKRVKSMSSLQVSRRFQEGAVDELSFLGPDVGHLAAILLGTETGTWYCEELDVSSSRTGGTYRFVCRDIIGSNDLPAVHLTPVPAGGVVYGSGDSAVVLTRDEAARLREWNLQKYSDLKIRLLGMTAVLVGLGSTTAFAAAGPGLAVPFALGGMSSLIYQMLLQRRVDGVTSNTSTPIDPPSKNTETGIGFRLGLALSNPTFRAACMVGGLVGSLAMVHSFGGPLSQSESMTDGTVSASMSIGAIAEARQVAAGLAGFLMQKVAVVWCSLLESSEKHSEKARFGWESTGKRSGIDDTWS